MALDLFTPDDTAILLIDHQVGTMSWVRPTGDGEMKGNALALAKAARALDMPLVPTTSMEDRAQGPLLEESARIAPGEYANRTKRTGVVNAMDDPAFAAAVKGTGCRNLIVAGVTDDVCTVYPTLTAVDEGYRVQAVADAGGPMSKAGDDVALRRMERAGAGITSINMILTELAGSWTSRHGQALLPVVSELVPG
ncbi:MAG TPA: isochorismatase family protein [Streptomyces sp.]|uniref:isochorismatase family protein n=1 Tax=Streptomyces sp. TaxID=1931 RepID=UPI002D5E3437|nr:isochorismatase family protein [Streptomyces sp.]HZG03092.1 isochorismatase family protein [Streptomyces sp.]